MEHIIIWLIAIIAVEAVTEIIVFSEIFAPFREIIFNSRFVFLHKLFSCGYCVSVWTAASIAWYVPWPTGVFGYFIKVFVIHRLSNIFHEFTVRYINRISIPKIIKNDNKASDRSVINE